MIVGFNFTKISAERNEGVKGKININNNVSIKNVEEKSLALANEKQKGIKFTFEFSSKYEPKLGDITIWGDVLYMADEKKSKEIMDGWKKDKKVPKDTMTSILNTVLSKCNVQALIISRDINLPPQIPLPKVEGQQQAGKAQ